MCKKRVELMPINIYNDKYILFATAFTQTIYATDMNMKNARIQFTIPCYFERIDWCYIHDNKTIVLLFI